MKKKILRILSFLPFVVLMFLITSTAMAAEGYYVQTAETATINNPNPTDRLNLRTRPSEDAPTLGKYYTGTYVELIGDEKDGWVKVRFCNLEGYMMTKFLAFGEDRGQVGSAIPGVKIKNTKGTGLNLRKTQSMNSSSLGLYKNGETVLVYGVSETWCHVQAEDGKIGFMLRESLSPLIEFNTGSGESGSTGGSGTGTTTAMVYNPNPDDRLNLRTAPNADAPT